MREEIQFSININSEIKLKIFQFVRHCLENLNLQDLGRKFEFLSSWEENSNLYGFVYKILICKDLGRTYFVRSSVENLNLEPCVINVNFIRPWIENVNL